MALYIPFGASRNRKKHSPDGTAPGIQYNRHRPGVAGQPRPGVPRRGPVPQDYLSTPLPDAYDPHPGEAAFLESSYEPYQSAQTRLAPDELCAPLPRFALEPDPVEYDDLLMTDKVFEQAMRVASALPDMLSPVPLDNDLMANDVFVGEPAVPELVDEIAGGGFGAIGEPRGDLDAACQSGFGVPGDIAFGPQAGLENLIGATGMLSGHDAGLAVPDTLEQVVLPFEPEPGQFQYGPDPMLDDPLLMDPWMMPGMEPPGFGPMGPMM